MADEPRAAVVGGIVVAVLVGLIGYLNAGKERAASSSGADGLRISAAFNRVDGLHEGDGVFLSGVKIGNVEKMWLDAKYRAIVTFSLDVALKIPKDSSAAIHTDGLFGSKFVVLEPGVGDAALKTGDRLTMTQDAVVVSDLLDLIISEGKANRAQAKPREAPRKTP